jgi:hypothetical protein
MRNRQIFIICTMLLALSCALPFLHGQGASSVQEEEWRRLTPEQKESLKERYRTFKGMTPEQKQELKDRLAQLRRMNRRDRELILKNYDGYRRLAPPPRQRLEQQ